MILRGLFWIALVGVLMPHEPNLGLGRPGDAASILPSSITSIAGQAVDAPQKACLDHADGCAVALGLVDRLQNLAVSSLDQVRVELEAAEAKRHQQRLAYNG